MSSSPATPATHNRIVFLTRDPVVHEQSGSTTYINSLFQLLRAQGAEITLVATTAGSRSPRLFFRAVASVPPGITLRFPGYLRIGSLYVRPFHLKAWARALARAGNRKPWLRSLNALLKKFYGPSLYTGAWDLTPLTPAECRCALQEIEATQATAVIGNYCLWGSLFGDGRTGHRRTAILMHDLLSARAERFAQSGTPLDMPAITFAEELGLLAGAHTALAAQQGEADLVRSQLPQSTTVVVTPVVLHPEPLDPGSVLEGRCLFVGSNIAPNRNALEFLLQSVWPTVRAQVPGATLVIAGSVGLALAPDERSATLASLGVEILGKVPSLRAEYARAAVCLVPLLLGTGIKIKLLEALSFGKAIVSTPIGVEGLEAWVSDTLCIAGDGPAFAAALIALLTDENLRRRQEAAALQLVTTHFGPGRELDPAFVRALL